MLMLLCAFGFVSQLHCDAIATDGAALKVAVAYVADRTGYPDRALSEAAQFVLAQALREVEEFEVTPVDLVKEVIAALKLRPPLSDSEMCQLASELKVDWAIRAVLERVTIDRRTNTVSIPMTAEAVGKDLRVIVSRASAIGTCSAKGDLANSLVLYATLVGAINDACTRIAEQLEYSAKVKGLLLLPPVNNHIRANIGIHQGLKVGAQLLVVWRNQPVAWAKVVDVNDDDCHAALLHVAVGKRLEPNMRVLVLTNPVAHEAPTYREQIERELRKATRDLFWAVAITFGALIATDVIK